MNANLGCIKTFSRSLALLQQDMIEDKVQVQKCQFACSVNPCASVMPNFRK